MKQPYFGDDGYIFLGGYLVRSFDGGRSWQGPYYPPHIKPERNFNPYGVPVPAYNRGALYEDKDGRILWIVAAADSIKKTSNYLIVSKDKGLTWEYTGEVAKDSKISFNEASVYETPKGDIVGFLRTGDFDDQAVIARSKDGGKTFKWESMGFQGHPLMHCVCPITVYCLPMGTGINHLVYVPGYLMRNTDFKTAPEIVLREDGGNGDIGYTWPVQLDKNRVLVVYYFNKENGIRHIAGTILEIK